MSHTSLMASQYFNIGQLFFKSSLQFSSYPSFNHRLYLKIKKYQFNKNLYAEYFEFL